MLGSSGWRLEHHRKPVARLALVGFHLPLPLCVCVGALRWRWGRLSSQRNPQFSPSLCLWYVWFWFHLMSLRTFLEFMALNNRSGDSVRSSQVKLFDVNYPWRNSGISCSMFQLPTYLPLATLTEGFLKTIPITFLTSESHFRFFLTRPLASFYN